jgi:ribosome-binding factor A
VSQRTDRIAGEIQSALGEILSRQAIKDPRVRDAGLLTITRVEVSGDLRHAKILFTIFGGAQDVMQKAEAGLEHGAAFLQREVTRRLRLRVVPQLHFSVDRGYEGAARVDVLFRTMDAERRAAAAALPREAAPAVGTDAEASASAPQDSVDDKTETPASTDPGSPGVSHE